jgi:hypothetical protein
MHYLLILPATFFFHPPYSWNLVVSDFHFFAHFEQILGGTNSKEEVRTDSTEW